MDDPACDRKKLERTYANFALINRVLAGWRLLYKGYLRPALRVSGGGHFLDVGFGGGDIPRALLAWAAKDGLELHITAIDPDPRAAAFAGALPQDPRLTFKPCHTQDLLAAGARFDVILSNHLLHHFAAAELADFCAACQALAPRALHNDIARSDIAWLAFSLTTPFFLNSFITPDGLTSVRRSFTARELAALAPAGWQVSAHFPFRLLLSRGFET